MEGYLHFIHFCLTLKPPHPLDQLTSTGSVESPTARGVLHKILEGGSTAKANCWFETMEKQQICGF